MSLEPTIIPGGWHADATPRGSSAVMMPLLRRLNTSRGPVDLPLGQNVLYVVCADLVDDDGVEYLCLAGQGHQDDLAWLWVSDGAAAFGTWYPLCPSYGTSPCAFSPDGLLYVSTPGTVDNIRIFDPLTRIQKATRTQPVGVRGIAAVSQGDIVHGPDGWTTRDTVHGQDAWYGHHGLGEYVEVGPYAIGQGIIADGLVAAGYGKLIEQGLCQFCRVHLAGEQFAIAVWQPGFAQAVLLWPTVADLQNLPPDVVPPPEPAPTPDPAPQPDPEPAPSPIPTPEEPMPKNKDQVRNDINELVRFYNEPDGLNRRARGLPSPVEFHDPAITDWFTLAVMDPIEQVKARIRTFPEWKDQHQNENPQ